MKIQRPILNIALVLLLLLCITGCKPKPGTWINDKIEAEQRQKFHTLNNELLEALKNNRPKALERIMSKEFLDAQGTNRLIELCSIRMRKGTQSMLDEYYIVHATPDHQSIKSFKYDVNSYTLSYDPLTQEKYIAFFVLQQSTEKWMLTANYNKYKYGWKIDDIELNTYTMEGKTAPELNKLAREEYDKKYLVNAVNYINLARQCLAPSAMWKYDEQDDMDVFYSRVLTEARETFKFPVVVKQLATKPTIFRQFMQDRGDGNFPMIYYISKVSLKDTLSVRLEHEQMKKAMPQIMPGIDKGNKHIYYTVFNGLPNWKQKNIPHFEITDNY